MASEASTPPPPKPSHILETCLYVKDMAQAVHFYRDVLGLKYPTTVAGTRITNFPIGDRTCLLLFQLGQTSDDVHPKDHPEHVIPNHGPSPALLKHLVGKDGVETLKQHFCLAVETREDVARWEKHLEVQGVNVLGIMEWDAGGRSVYFADPDGNVGEIGSRGLSEFY